MNIDRLRYFSAVVETRNLRRAAEVLGMNPGSLSKAISTLEEGLGVKLLRPDGRGIAITDEGMDVYHSSSRLLDEFRHFKTSMTLKRPQRPEVLRIGTYELFSTYFLSLAMKEALPGTDVVLLELTPGQIEEALLSNMIDIGLTHLPSPKLELASVRLMNFRMGIYGRAEWRQHEFTDWPFAIPITPVTIHSQEFDALDLWPTQIPRYVKYRFELLETALQTSRLGLSVLHCPEYIIHLHNRFIKDDYRLIELPLPEKMRKIESKIHLIGKKQAERLTLLEKKLGRFVRTELR